MNNKRREEENVMRIRRIPWIASSGPTTSQQEEEMYQKEKRKELLSIVHQPHRTFPSIQPKPKPRHDYPQGSYLKYVTDPTWNQSYYTKTPTIHVDQILTNLPQSVGGVVSNSPINDSFRDHNSSSVPPLIRPQQQRTVNFQNSPTYRMIVEEAEQQQQQQQRGNSPFPHHHQKPIQSTTFQTLMNHYQSTFQSNSIIPKTVEINYTNGVTSFIIYSNTSKPMKADEDNETGSENK